LRLKISIFEIEDSLTVKGPIIFCTSKSRRHNNLPERIFHGKSLGKYLRRVYMKNRDIGNSLVKKPHAKAEIMFLQQMLI
jgi:hypothetical protein